MLSTIQQGTRLQLNSIRNLNLQQNTIQNKLSNITFSNIGNNQTFSKIINQTNQTFYRLCKAILKKSHELRTPADNKTLSRLPQHNKFLTDLLLNISEDCFKNLIRNAKIQQINQRQILFQQRKPITHMLIVLQGKLGLYQNQRDQLSILLEKQRQISSDKKHKTKQKPKNKQDHFSRTVPRNKNNPLTNDQDYNPLAESNYNTRSNQNTIQHSPQVHNSRINQNWLVQKQIHHQHMVQNIFDGLTQISVKQIQHMRNRNMAINKKISLPLNYSRRLAQNQYKNYQFQKFINKGEQYGGGLRIDNKYHTYTVVSVEKSTIMILDINMVMLWFQYAFKVKQNQIITKLKKLSCFSFLDEDKILQIILCLRKYKIKRNQYLFKQGDPTEKLYFLINGEIKITKQTKLFEQNPNQLYVDRRRLMNKKISFQNTQNIQKVGILPYANLTSLYNYRPIRKNIQIGVITSQKDSFTLLGQGQMIQKKSRQTNAMIISFDASFYQIQIKLLEQILASNLPIFYNLLEKSLRKVILYRQNQYAQKIINQNKKNLDYFYYQENKIQATPRKYRIQKINNKLGSSPKIQEFALNNQEQKSKPFYTTFNFQKLIKSEKKSQNKFKPLSHHVRGATTELKSKRNNHQDSLESIQIKYDPLEQRLMGLSHSWKPIKKKVGQQLKVMQKISAKRHSINLLEPLIDQQYFSHTEREQKRITREHKMFRQSLGKKSK